MRKLNALTLSRLRIAQRCLVAATDADPELMIDPIWQRAMSSTCILLTRGTSEESEELREVSKNLSPSLEQ